MTIKERNELLLKNFNLLACIARSCNIKNADIDDLEMDACEKALQILDKYDSSKGALSTFLWPYIKQYLYAKNVNLPERLLKLSGKLNSVCEYLQSEICEKPSADKIAEYMGMSEEKVKKYLSQIAQYNTESLDKPVGSAEENCTLADFTPDLCTLNPETEMMRKEEIKIVQQCWNKLSKEDQKLLSMRTSYNGTSNTPMSLREMEKELGISRSTIALKQKKAENKLKENLIKMGMCA